MHDRYSIARLVFCYIICFAFLCYFLKGFVNIIPKSNPTFPDMFSKEEQNLTENEEKEEKKEITEAKNEAFIAVTAKSENNECDSGNQPLP